MKKNNLQNKPIDTVIFDCDGTLSCLEGMVELAKYNGEEEKIEEMTNLVMTSGGLSADFFTKRLNIIRPTRKQLIELSAKYYDYRTKNIEYLITDLQRQGINVFVFSAGFKQAVLPFAQKLGILAQHVYAIELEFNAIGDYLNYDRKSLLLDDLGKANLIQEIFSDSQQIVFIGDGANDIAVQPYVKKFIGYGAHYYRKTIKYSSDIYVPDLIEYWAY